ncbi:MAG: anti-sigma F factor, partial [Oscillospiraceae bacterium]|nr:anti-sigma F factor [Oscillospiraceae bacterium]
SAFVSQLNPTLYELDDIKTAVSEAVTNAIVHGYQAEVGMVHITCTLTENNAIISVADTGRGIEDITLARTPLYTGTEDGERSGLGFTVMETFMDTIEVVSTPGKGTTVIMKKQIGVPGVLSACVS